MTYVYKDMEDAEMYRYTLEQVLLVIRKRLEEVRGLKRVGAIDMSKIGLWG